MLYLMPPYFEPNSPAVVVLGSIHTGILIALQPLTESHVVFISHCCSLRLAKSDHKMKVK